MNESLNLLFDPLVDYSLLLVMIGAAVLIIALSYWRQGPTSLLRAAFIVSLLFVLANPSFISETRRYLKDTVLIVVDETDSQKQGEREQQTTAALQALLARLEKINDLNILRSTVRNSLSGEDGDKTLLFKAQKEMLKSIPPSQVAGSIFITDGQVHDQPSELNGSGPLHVLLTGSEDEKDRVLTVETAPSFGIVNKETVIKIKTVDKEPVETAKTIVAEVKLDGKIIKNVAVRTDRITDIAITIPHGGANFVEITVPELEGEISLQNNKAFITVNGIRDRLKVLLVSGEPHMGERGWRNILKSDPSVDLVHFTILRPPEKQDGTPINELSLIPFPINELFERKLDEFDLIIFDRYRRRGVLAPPYLRNIVNYVMKGGALLEAAGPSFATSLSLYKTPLSDVLPGQPTGSVFKQGFVPLLSDTGKRHPVTARLSTPKERENWGRWFRMIDTNATAGTVLMTGPAEKPLLILERYGEGRVAQMLSDHAWLWGNGFEGGGPQGELLRRIAHWLMQEPELEEERLIGRVNADRLELERWSLDAGPKTVTVEKPDGTTAEVALSKDENGIDTGSLGITSPGLYSLSSDALKTLVAVGRLNPLESRDIRSSALPLTPYIQQTGGTIKRTTNGVIPEIRRTSPDGLQAGQNWIGLRKNKSYEITGYTRTALTPPAIALSLLLGILCLAWWRESR
ncbi:hypothetical protein [Sneathiella sp.]|jgi:hypothetical protein|uniref:hypothetical protein n=1 Tax=Sneathiella sp. TaxID=1964365 RepID=UPI0039E6503F